jgi:hypothetical protein
MADFPDMHDFALPFYSGIGGTYPIWTNYDDATLDALIALGAQTPDGPARAAIYKQIAQLAIADCPSVAILQPIGRHFERDWVVGWYYNPVYPGEYFYNLWKWYYVPHVLYNPPVQPRSDSLGADVNYDGRVNMVDIGIVAFCFGQLAGPPIDPRWIFRCDTNVDRKVDMKDIGNVAANYNVTRMTDTWIATGHDPAIVSVAASSLYAIPGDPVTLTVVAQNLGVVDDAFAVAVDYNGTLIEKRLTSGLGPGATATMTFSWNTAGATEGVYFVTATAIAVGDPNPSNNRQSTSLGLFKATFSQIDFVLDDVSTPDSDWGAVDLSFPGSADILYLNLKSNGTWSIQNLPVLSIEGSYAMQTQRFWFPLGVPSGNDATSIVYGVAITDHVLDAAPAEARSAPVGSVGYEVYNGGEDVTLHTAPAPAEAVVGGPVADPVQHKKQGVPNQEAGKNECAPTAVSNSVQFLNDKHNLGIDPAELTIDKMKTATQWKVPPRTKACYIWHNDSRPEGARNAWWEDKDAYMKAHNLNITTKMVLPKDIGTLIAEIDACQDIEAELNGHTVCVVGMADLGHGNYSVTISHDSNQNENPGGCITETGIWHSDTGTWSGALAGYGLNYFVVECPKK